MRDCSGADKEDFRTRNCPKVEDETVSFEGGARLYQSHLQRISTRWSRATSRYVPPVDKFEVSKPVHPPCGDWRTGPPFLRSPHNALALELEYKLLAREH